MSQLFVFERRGRAMEVNGAYIYMHLLGKRRACACIYNCERSKFSSAFNGPDFRYIIASEASFLVRSMARIFAIYINI